MKYNEIASLCKEDSIYQDTNKEIWKSLYG